MFETAELGRTISKTEYGELVPKVRTGLLEAQHRLKKANFPVIILVNGVEGAGKGDVVNLLNEWMDTRDIVTVAFDEPTEAESHRPPYWRYWMALPPRGRIGVYVSTWYTEPISRCAYGEISDAELEASLRRISAFERTLADGGALFIKLWLHISKKQQKRRFKELESKAATRWRVDKRDHKHAKLYDTFRRVCERTIRETSTGQAPWFVVESGDWRFRNISIGQHIAEQIQRRLQVATKSIAPVPQESIDDPYTILDTLDLSQELPKKLYRGRLEELQARLNKLSRQASARKLGSLLVFEGSDAAGKGGAIRRITASLDARHCRVIPIAAPTDEEKGHHYLWRFWRHLPRLGRITIYDRSWYGRVLVERIEGFAKEEDWMRAYKEINDFEQQLVEDGILLIKFWLHISSEEQLQRFQERERLPWKQYKITDEDYRNRDKSNLYEQAASEMIGRTSTEYAPWTLVEAEDKRHARVKVLEVLCERLEEALDNGSD